jgi:hypothetical protein
MVKIGRNHPCPCGGGQKYKHCHGRLDRAPAMLPPSAEIERLLIQHQAQERIRQAQQGQGRGIVAAKSRNHQLVAVGNTLFWSQSWKTFPDFLNDYMKKKLTADWGNAELQKPEADRHPIAQWFAALGRQREKLGLLPGEGGSRILATFKVLTMN